MGPLIPILGGVALVGGGLVALRIKAQQQGPKSVIGPAPDFKNSPPAAAAIPAGRSAIGLPVLTQDQFNAQPADSQAEIRRQALNGILTLTATNGALFADQTPKDIGGPEAFVGVFKPGEDLRGMFIVVDVALAKRFGVSLDPVTTGNVIFEPLDKNGQTTVPAISRDPRMPGVKLDIPINAITGAGDP